jgi:hypothetical protein
MSNFFINPYRLVAVSGKAVHGMPPQELAALLMGAVGTKVSVQFEREEGGQAQLLVTSLFLCVCSVSACMRACVSMWACVSVSVPSVLFARPCLRASVHASM